MEKERRFIKDLSKEQSPQEVLPVTAEFIKGFYGSKQFYDSLFLSVKELKQKGRETGFVIVKDIASNQVFVSEVETSESSEYVKLNKVSEALMDDLTERFPSGKFFKLGSLHFHPEMDREPMPSDGDLEQTADAREFERVING